MAAFRPMVTALAMSLCLLAAPAAAEGLKKPAARPQVAVLYFNYRNEKDDELAALRKGLTSLLVSDLSDLGQIRFIERERLQEVLDELKLSQSKDIDPDTALKVGKLLAAQYTVMGAYLVVLGQLTITWKVLDMQTAEILKSGDVRGRPEQFYELEQKLSAQLRSFLAERVPALKAAALPAARQKPAALPTRVAVEYGKALEELDQKNKAAARVRLEQVVKAQPDFELATVDLAALMK